MDADGRLPEEKDKDRDRDGRWRCDSTTTRLLVVLSLYSAYVCTMLAFGIITHALVVISEGLHAISDWFSYTMTLYFHQAKNRPRDPATPFGYGRSTVIGGILNALFLVALALFITLEAVTRYVEPHQHDIDYLKVIIVGSVGLGVNITCAVLMHTSPDDTAAHGHAHFGGDHSHSHGGPDVNIKAMLMHLLIDICSSGVVLISGLVGFFYKGRHWTVYVDPTGAMLVAVLAVVMALPLLVHCFRLLLQSPPDRFDSLSLEKSLRAIPHVVGLSKAPMVWRLTDEVVVAQCFLEAVRTDGATDVTHNDLLTRARSVLESHDVDIEYSTIQITYDTAAGMRRAHTAGSSGTASAAAAPNGSAVAGAGGTGAVLGSGPTFAVDNKEA